MTFGDRLHELRVQQRMTLSQLGRKVGLSEATIQRYESGNIKNPPRDRIEALAAALDVPPAVLLGVEAENLDTEIRLLARDMQDLPDRKKQRILSMMRLMLEDARDD